MIKSKDLKIISIVSLCTTIFMLLFVLPFFYMAGGCDAKLTIKKIQNPSNIPLTIQSRGCIGGIEIIGTGDPVQLYAMKGDLLVRENHTLRIIANQMACITSLMRWSDTEVEIVDSPQTCTPVNTTDKNFPLEFTRIINFWTLYTDKGEITGYAKTSEKSATGILLIPMLCFVVCICSFVAYKVVKKKEQQPAQPN